METKTEKAPVAKKDTKAVVSTTKVVKEKKVKAEKVPGVRGRKTDPNSSRQIRLKRFEAVIAAGGKVGRGRPVGSKEKPKV